MKNISKPRDAKYFMAYDGSTYHVGRTDTNQVTSTGLTNLVVGDDPDDFLTKTEGMTLPDFNPLPAFGEQVQAGIVYTHNTKLVIARQDHLRTADDPATVPALFSTYRVDTGTLLEWVPNENVMVGDKRSYGGNEYACVQSHQTLEGWEPSITPALWAEYRVNADGAVWIANERVFSGETRVHYSKAFLCLIDHVTAVGLEPNVTRTHWGLVIAPWMQPAGGHDAYKLGDRVTHNGDTWETTIDNNVWEPGVAGWVVV